MLTGLLGQILLLLLFLVVVLLLPVKTQSLPISLVDVDGSYVLLVVVGG